MNIFKWNNNTKSNQTIVPTSNEIQFRKYVLTAPINKILLSIGMPLVIYQIVNQLFKLLDIFMASQIGSMEVGAVTYISQLSLIVQAIATGISLAGGIKLSEEYGREDYTKLRQTIGGLISLVFFISAFILLLIPLTDTILTIAKTPVDFITIGRFYFIIQLLTLILIFFNSIYLSIEGAAGHSMKILIINLSVLISKAVLTYFFTFILKTGITMIAIAGLISQLIPFIFFIIFFLDKNKAFSLSLRDIKPKFGIILPLLKLALPLSSEKFLFAFGKAIINVLMTSFNPLMISAFGVSDTITGINAVSYNGFQNAAASCISQSLGANNKKRALNIFYYNVLLNLIIGLIMITPSILFAPLIMDFFANSNDEFLEFLQSIYYKDLFSTLPLAINSAVLALFYGFGKTKFSLIINSARIYAFRIPVLWFLSNFTSLGNNSIGYMLIISNVSTSIFGLCLAHIFIIRETA
jgi:putative efflux protein, MATE family